MLLFALTQYLLPTQDYTFSEVTLHTPNPHSFMALRIEHTGSLVEDKTEPKIGDMTEHGIIKRIENISVSQFITHALCGGISLYGFDTVLIDERFVTSTSSTEDCESVAERVVIAEDDEEGAEVIGEEVEDRDEESVEGDGLPCIVGGD